MRKRCHIVLALLLLGTLFTWQPGAQARTVDHYILALSWSPSFCTSPEAERETLQCGRQASFAFVVHGLWPQYRTGSPQYCRARERWVPEHLIAAMLPLMPSKRLVIHQWRKHGTCSGLSMHDYFGLVRRLFGKIKIPARYRYPATPVTARPAVVLSDFIEANPGLDLSMLGLACRPSPALSTLTEIRICFSPAGDFAHCSPRSRSDCQAETLVLPPVKGTSEETNR